MSSKMLLNFFRTSRSGLIPFGLSAMHNHKILSLFATRVPGFCCDIGQIDIFSRIELNPSFVLSSDNTNCKNDIQ